MKYTQFFKLDVIVYHKQEHSYQQTTKYFNSPDHKTVEVWVKILDKYGVSGIATCTSRTVYSPTFKLPIIIAILDGQSTRQVTITLISEPLLISTWYHEAKTQNQSEQPMTTKASEVSKS